MKHHSPHRVPEPMRVIREREAEAIALPFPYRVPTQNYQDMVDAAKAYAEWNNSDPFAFGRAMMLMQRGIERASQLGAEYRSKLRARQIANQLAASKAALYPKEELVR